MTGRTHDLAAFTALNLVIATQPLPQMSLPTAVVAGSMGLIGGLLPDIDEPAADIWDRIPAGSLIGKLIRPLLGSHRMISHSILGVGLCGWILTIILERIRTVILVDMHVVWWATMTGYLSHLVADSFTTEGVPWFFPIPVRIGFPPFRPLRVKTGGIIEKSLIFPGLLLLNGYLFYYFYPVYLSLIKNFLAAN